MIVLGSYVVVFIAGILTGALIWRNNAKKFERYYQCLEKEGRAKVDAIIDAVK
jgi:hypothetical protein